MSICPSCGCFSPCGRPECVAQLRADIFAIASAPEPKTAQAHLGDLLARIHRDGGRYEAEHGMDKAVADADRIVADLLASAPSGWRPIETAPKDGTWIAVSSWHNPYYCGCVQWLNSQWWRDDDRPDNLFEASATHWMPLPLPPSEREG